MVPEIEGELDAGHGDVQGVRDHFRIETELVKHEVVEFVVIFTTVGDGIGAVHDLGARDGVGVPDQLVGIFFCEGGGIEDFFLVDDAGAVLGDVGDVVPDGGEEALERAVLAARRRAKEHALAGQGFDFVEIGVRQVLLPVGQECAVNV